MTTTDRSTGGAVQTPPAAPSSRRVAAALLVPPMAWMLSFSAVYALQEVACDQGWIGDEVAAGVSVFGLVSGAVLVAAIAASAASWVLARRLVRPATGAGDDEASTDGLARVAVVVAPVFGLVTAFCLLALSLPQDCR